MENENIFTPRIENGDYVGSTKTLKVEEMDNKYSLNALKKVVRMRATLVEADQLEMLEEVDKVLHLEIVTRLSSE